MVLKKMTCHVYIYLKEFRSPIKWFILSAVFMCTALYQTSTQFDVTEIRAILLYIMYYAGIFIAFHPLPDWKPNRRRKGD